MRRQTPSTTVQSQKKRIRRPTLNCERLYLMRLSEFYNVMLNNIYELLHLQFSMQKFVTLCYTVLYTSVGQSLQKSSRIYCFVNSIKCLCLSVPVCLQGRTNFFRHITVHRSEPSCSVSIVTE